ncbi:MAG TPA: hypothetical protein VMU33_06100 [Burkholderiaceae bacterium]|nr:hypothetical protein [Burkholderiaceae bacterium]
MKRLFVPIVIALVALFGYVAYHSFTGKHIVIRFHGTSTTVL